MTRDTFIRLLNEQPRQNDGVTYTKVNIHISLRGEIVKYCLQINKHIRSITPSQVDFGPNSFQIPHLTLDMGYVRTVSDFEDLMIAVCSFAKELSSFDVNPTRPYLNKPRRNYVFIDTNQQDHIINIKQRAKKMFSKWLIPLDWDVSKSTPHITVGYISDDYDEVESMINSFSVGPKWTANAIEVSYTGSRGSCIGVIRSFEFG